MFEPLEDNYDDFFERYYDWRDKMADFLEK
jgi:hypothetical protein